jgi:hypothetical protein
MRSMRVPRSVFDGEPADARQELADRRLVDALRAHLADFEGALQEPRRLVERFPGV